MATAKSVQEVWPLYCALLYGSELLKKTKQSESEGRAVQETGGALPGAPIMS